MEAVGPEHTGIPSVWNDRVELGFATEWDWEDALAPVATEKALLAMLGQQDTVAPKFKVRHVPSKEEYLYITWSSQVGAMKAVGLAEYGKAQRRDKHGGTCMKSSVVHNSFFIYERFIYEA